jgi:hypothetical protein
LKKSQGSAEASKRRMSTSTINSKKNLKTKESLNEDVSGIMQQEETGEMGQEVED